MDSWFTIKPVNSKGNQSWIFIAKAPILWPHDAKNWLIGKDPDAGKDWRQEEMGTTEDEMVGGHHRLDGHEFKQAPWIGDGQGSMACCSPWGHRVGHDWVTELNWTDFDWNCVKAINLKRVSSLMLCNLSVQEHRIPLPLFLILYVSVCLMFPF